MSNPGDLNATCHDYYDGQRVVETRSGGTSGGGLVIRHQVWGLQYIDELVQVTVNRALLDDPAMDASDPDHDVQAAYAVLDPMFSLLGLIDASGDLVERYELDPYGRRQVFGPADANDTTLTLALNSPARVDADSGGSVEQPYALTDVSHQGLPLDENTGLLYNRARYRNPATGRFISRDPLGYPDGMNGYASWHLEHFGLDPAGLEEQVFEKLGFAAWLTNNGEGLKEWTRSGSGKYVARGVTESWAVTHSLRVDVNENGVFLLDGGGQGSVSAKLDRRSYHQLLTKGASINVQNLDEPKEESYDSSNFSDASRFTHLLSSGTIASSNSEVTDTNGCRVVNVTVHATFLARNRARIGSPSVGFDIAAQYRGWGVDTTGTVKVPVGEVNVGTGEWAASIPVPGVGDIRISPSSPTDEARKIDGEVPSFAHYVATYTLFRDDGNTLRVVQDSHSAVAAGNYNYGLSRGQLWGLDRAGLRSDNNFTSQFVGIRAQK